MARRKSDAEVGPLGVWAYNTRDALDLSVEAVIAALPTTYNPATLRKVEGGSSRPGSRMWRELRTLYTRMADERAVAIEDQPPLNPERSEAPAGDASLAAAFRALADELQAWRLQDRYRIAELEATVSQLVEADLAERESGAATARPVRRG